MYKQDFCQISCFQIYLSFTITQSGIIHSTETENDKAHNKSAVCNISTNKSVVLDASIVKPKIVVCIDKC